MEQILHNGKQVYLINVPGKNGYSFAIATDGDPIGDAMDLDLFDDMQDAHYCQIEEMGEEDWKFWKESVIEY